MATESELKHIAELRQLTRDWQLDHADILDKYTDEQLADDVYNGIGPEAFPSWLRKVIDCLNPTLEPVALIHDTEWHETDHTEPTWHATNDRFRDNGLKAADARYGWWNPLRYRVRRQARLFRLACETTPGWRAWLDGDKTKETDR